MLQKNADFSLVANYSIFIDVVVVGGGGVVGVVVVVVVVGTSDSQHQRGLSVGCSGTYPNRLP